MGIGHGMQRRWRLKCSAWHRSGERLSDGRTRQTEGTSVHPLRKAHLNRHLEVRRQQWDRRR
jgi:hypothetical protein